ncbi:MAG: glycosaminoglycan attachment protein [Planctomycetota bacterium]|nr:MAG: glycosaminoglycan attachment protein [Planctomycetota bacterium]
MTEKPIEIRELDVKRFTALVSASRSAGLEFYGKELEWYSNEDETILGVILLDLIDNDFVSVMLARDEGRRYRCFDLEVSVPSIDEARDQLHRSMKWHTGQGLKVYPQGDKRQPIDLFSPVVPNEKQHPCFHDLATNEAFLPARSIISEMMPHFVDIDGTFVKEFQTKGFDARLWELYLNAYLGEEKLFVEREYPSPDFIVRKYGKAVAVEAVIVGRRTVYKRRLLLDEEPREPTVEEMLERNRDEIPIKFGSSLYSKLQKKYWELEHVKDKPLVFAIADFHDDQSMLWTSTGLMDYLYGVHHDFYYDEHGKMVITPQKIDTHQVGDKRIPSGFFFQPDAENISAVLFSASGTISKFNRLGRQAGFRHPEVTMIRIGTCYNHDGNAWLPKVFRYEVDEQCHETWGEGLSMFHNPNARYPVPRELFPSIAHHRFEAGQIASTMPEFHPFASNTLLLRVRGKPS